MPERDEKSIEINDLPPEETLTPEEMERIFGAGRQSFRPSFEVLEAREMMDAGFAPAMPLLSPDLAPAQTAPFSMHGASHAPEHKQALSHPQPFDGQVLPSSRHLVTQGTLNITHNGMTSSIRYKELNPKIDDLGDSAWKQIKPVLASSLLNGINNTDMIFLVSETDPDRLADLMKFQLTGTDGKSYTLGDKFGYANDPYLGAVLFDKSRFTATFATNDRLMVGWDQASNPGEPSYQQYVSHFVVTGGNYDPAGKFVSAYSFDLYLGKGPHYPDNQGDRADFLVRTLDQYGKPIPGAITLMEWVAKNAQDNNRPAVLDGDWNNELKTSVLAALDKLPQDSWAKYKSYFQNQYNQIDPSTNQGPLDTPHAGSNAKDAITTALDGHKNITDPSNTAWLDLQDPAKNHKRVNTQVLSYSPFATSDFSIGVDLPKNYIRYDLIGPYGDNKIVIDPNQVKAPSAGLSPEARVLGAFFAQPQQLTQKRIFNEEFNQPVGSQPNDTTWYSDKGSDPNNGAVKYVNDSSTLSVVSDKDASDGKALAMTIYPESKGEMKSARINTSIDPVAGHLRYGRIEARIKLPGGPDGQGVWPAFWMLGSDHVDKDHPVKWPNCGEIDIMEYWGNHDFITGTLVLSENGAPKFVPTESPHQSFHDGAYHMFAVEWSPESISFSVDGTVYKTLYAKDYNPSSWNFDKPFYIILNISDNTNQKGGGSATEARQTMYVDYVRAYSNLASVTI